MSSFSEKSKAQDIALIKKALSVERFESHRKDATDSDEMVFARYQWNAAICENFYAPIRVLEVVLRNSYNDAIAAKTSNQDWLTTIPVWLKDSGKSDVIVAHEYLKERKKPITQARVVQEMSFGFWTSLLNSRYETLFHAIGAKVFPGIPRTIRTRAEASQRFERIRLLRNYIFHFRRIWNRPDLQLDFRLILEAIDWVNPDARRLLLPSDVESKYAEIFSKRL